MCICAGEIFQVKGKQKKIGLKIEREKRNRTNKFEKKVRDLKIDLPVCVCDYISYLLDYYTHHSFALGFVVDKIIGCSINNNEYTQQTRTHEHI